MSGSILPTGGLEPIMLKYSDYEYLMVEFVPYGTTELLRLYYKTKQIRDVYIKNSEEMVMIVANLIYDNGGNGGVDYLFHGPIDKNYKKRNRIEITDYTQTINRDITYFSEKSQLKRIARPYGIHLLNKKEYETLDQDLITKVYYIDNIELLDKIPLWDKSPLWIDDVDKPKLSQYEIAIRTWLREKKIKNIEVVEESPGAMYRLYNITNPTRNYIYYPDADAIDTIKAELDGLKQTITALVVASKGVASKGGRTRGRRTRGRDTRGRGAIRKRKRTNRINRICRRSRNHPHNRIA